MSVFLAGGPLGFLTAGASLPSLVVELRLQSAGSGVVAHGLRCPEACGIFPDQGWNPCLLHWQADSLSLSHQGRPTTDFYKEGLLCQDLKNRLKLSQPDKELRKENS